VTGGERGGCSGDQSVALLSIRQDYIKTSDIHSAFPPPKNHYLCQVIDRAGRDQLWRGGLEKRREGEG
jgi:hypothetical protein